MGNELVLSNTIESNSQISIYSLSGRKLFQKKLYGKNIQIPPLSIGIYLVKFVADGVGFSQKIVVEQNRPPLSYLNYACFV